MKTNQWVIAFLIFVLYSGVQLRGQQNNAQNGQFEAYKARAERGNAEAQRIIGWYYENGQGVPQDYAMAVSWFRKAAEQGEVEAEFKLGFSYEQGQGVTKDYAQAIIWFRKAANQGNAAGQYWLGLAYGAGEGVTKDEAEAVKWYRKAAEQNFFLAQFALAGCYDTGQGVAKDEVQAMKWCRKAAEQGYAAAQYNLGHAYCLGEGVPIDYVEAYKWLNLAAAQGDENAKKGRAIIAAEMTPEQIAEAQRRSTAFAPQKEMPNSNSANSASPANPTFTGTGFFITDDGYLISNNHVVKDATKVRLLTSVGLIDAKVVQVDAANDLALLKAEGKFSSLPISPSRSAQLGSTVATVGFPDIGLQGFSPKLAKGEIASLSGASDDPRYFQISVPVQPGNSGGALVDEWGNVIGIVSAKLDASAALAASGALPENVNYAVKSSFLLSFLESLPGVEAKLKAPNTADLKFEDVVKSAQAAAVLVLVY